MSLLTSFYLDDSKYLSTINDLSQQIEQLKQDLTTRDEMDQNQKLDFSESKSEFEKIISALKSEKLEQKANYENEIAVLTQKLDLSQTQINELKVQQIEHQKVQQALLGVLETPEDDNVNEILQQQKQESLVELKKLEAEFSASKSRLAK